MDFMRLGRVLCWGSASAAFAVCWGWAIGSWGLMGLYVGWVPAVVLAPFAAALMSFLWSVIGLAALIGWHCHASERGGAFEAEPSL
jgi:hypothetical protein